MKPTINRRSLGVLGVVLASQLLSACIIIPRPFHRHPRVLYVEPGYQTAPPAEYRDYRRGYRR